MKKTLETKIKFILVTDKIYKVTRTDFTNLIIAASETDLVAADVPADELFELEDFKEFKVILRNWKGKYYKVSGFIELKIAIKWLFYLIQKVVYTKA